MIPDSFGRRQCCLLEELLASGVEEIEVKTFDDETGQVITAMARDIRVEKYADVLKQITLEDGTTFRCTESHLIMDNQAVFQQEIHIAGYGKPSHYG